jgi:histidine triad (HIT) family protein
VGLEVPHAHVHLVPLNKISDINFSKKRLKIDNLELEKIRQLIKSKL